MTSLPVAWNVATPPTRAGIGLRPRHHLRVRSEHPDIAWLEVHAENFMAGGTMVEDLDEIRDHYPLSLHAVGLSLGSANGIDPEHARALKHLVDRYQPCLVSDHLSWSEAAGACLPDLLPLPYNQEALDTVSDNVARSQDILQRPLLIENPSVYLRASGATLSEAEFLSALVMRTGCGVLLDVNNIIVSANNLGEDAETALREYLDTIPAASIGEIHLAGHAEHITRSGALVRIDDHGSAAPAPVLALYRQSIAKLGPRPTLIEWDTNIPELEILLAEAHRAQVVLDEFAGKKRHALAS